MTAAPDIGSVARSAQWLAHRYDERNDSIHFVHIPRERHGDLPFLTDEYIAQAAEPQVALREHILPLAPSPAPLRFILHSAFCCSTLLTRALNVPGTSMALSEPVLLNDMVGWRHRGERDGRKIAMVLSQMLDLLARPFAEGESIILKPSNLVNVLAPAMLGLKPGSRALLLHAPLEDYLGSIARKGLWSRVWVRDLLVKLINENFIRLGLEGDDYLRLTDVQAAAIGWLSQQAYFRDLTQKFETDRVRTLSSTVLTSKPRDTLAALAAFFSLSLSEAQLDDIANGPVFTRHSKSGEAFNPAERTAIRDRALADHADEIAKVSQWARVIAKQYGIPMDLPASLLI